MTTLSGILQAPDGTAIAGAKITFEAVRNYEQVTFHASSSLTTGSDGSYSVTMPVGSFNVFINYGTNRTITVGLITILTVSADGTLNDYLLTNNDPAYVDDVLTRLAAAGGVSLVNGAMDKNQNLSDVTNKATSRTNLDVYSKTESLAVGNSNTINADAYDGGIIAAIATGKNVVFSGSYALTSAIQLRPGQELKSSGGVISYTGASAFILASGNKITSVSFSGPIGSFALMAEGAIQSVILDSVICSQCSLITINPTMSYSSADWILKSNITKDVAIRNCSGTYLSGTTPTASFIRGAYIDGLLVYGGRAKGYKYGVTYWGGDSSFAVDGAIINQRKCDNIKVIGFIADNCQQAGAWGSMAISAEFIGVHAYRDSIGGDVGLDHEGTIFAKNIGCHVKNYQNGNYASFFGTQNLDITSCSSEQLGGYPHYRTYNSSLDADSGPLVSISGGSFSCTDTATSGLYATIDQQSGPSRKLTIENTRIIDSRVSSQGTNMGDVSITGNSFIINNPATLALDVIGVIANNRYLGDIDVQQNTIRVKNPVSITAGTNFIKATTSSFNASRTIRIQDNKSSLAINITEAGTNAGISGIFYVSGNIASAITRTNSGAKALLLPMQDNNYTASGTAITIA